jgi:hypothetical protein
LHLTSQSTLALVKLAKSRGKIARQLLIPLD